METEDNIYLIKSYERLDHPAALYEIDILLFLICFIELYPYGNTSY